MKSALPGVCRIVAILLLAGGICMGVLDAYGAARAPISPEETLAGRLPALAEAVAIVLGLAGLSVLMYGMAVMMEAEPEVAADGDWGTQISELRQSVQRLETAVHRLVERAGDSSGGHGQANFPEVGAGDTVAGTTLASPESMHQVIALLQEIREVALLSDAQRQERLRDARQQRLNNMVGEVERLLDLKEWSTAETALAAVDNEFPREPIAEQLQSRLDAGRKDAQRDSFSKLRERVEDLMAVWAWDQAYGDTAKFVENFPDHPEGQELLSRVMRERDAYLENTANLLYEEIRSDIDRRLWRRAMTNAVKLLECAPGHRRSVGIRAQLKTIRENAEIEERQEQERRIQELIRTKRFPEAIDSAEDLLRRFPSSPQAESLQKLLPKMRELAIGNEVEAPVD
jgi:outer membrane protein assembly factor BamD (BamD/ComL family)